MWTTGKNRDIHHSIAREDSYFIVIMCKESLNGSQQILEVMQRMFSGSGLLVLKAKANVYFYL